MNITPIETRYKGFRFRSRLEARWAVFFDTLGIPWEYEKEGFELEPLPQCDCYEKGCDCADYLGRYLPDFWLPSIGIWFEVKGRWPNHHDIARMGRFERLGNKAIVIAVGQMPAPESLEPGGHPYPKRLDDFDIVPTGDNHYAWCLCPWCGKPGIEFDARGARVCGYKSHFATEDEAMRSFKHGEGHWRADDKCYTGNHPRIVAAYTAARSSRFEFGESGAN